MIDFVPSTWKTLPSLPYLSGGCACMQQVGACWGWEFEFRLNLHSHGNYFSFFFTTFNSLFFSSFSGAIKQNAVVSCFSELASRDWLEFMMSVDIGTLQIENMFVVCAGLESWLLSRMKTKSSAKLKLWALLLPETWSWCSIQFTSSQKATAIKHWTREICVLHERWNKRRQQLEKDALERDPDTLLSHQS